MTEPLIFKKEVIPKTLLPIIPPPPPQKIELREPTHIPQEPTHIPQEPTHIPKNLNNTSVIHFLKGKNIFVFDTETTGLPERCPNGWGSHWSYFMNEKYDSSRIISIAWSAIHNFNQDNQDQIDNSIKNVQHYLRYPEGFTEINNSHIHGIKYEDTINNGFILNDLLEKKGLCVDILKADYIVAHNIGFDYHVLMNELYRLGTEHAKACMLHLSTLYSKKKCICTGELSTEICKLKFNKVSNYKGNKKSKSFKMPKLSELYVYYYGKEFENQHSADGDVKALLSIMKKL